MIIFALDLGVHTGWALLRHGAGGQIESGVQTFDLQRGESAGMRYIRFNKWLEEFPIESAIEPRGFPTRHYATPRVLIVYELSHHRGGYTTEIHLGLATRVQEWAVRREYQYQGVHSATLKKWTTGNGRASKEEMVETVRHKWKPDVQNDDEADAVALLHYSLERFVSPE